ncbi:MAG: hypothetical protein WAS33_09580 [Candidatus Promineifilaceae bacterium]
MKKRPFVIVVSPLTVLFVAAILLAGCGLVRVVALLVTRWAGGG